MPWVAGDLGTTLGTATGAALAFQQEGSDRVCVCTFGDGTANRGDVHEALNLAACWRLPIVYVCQNNGWAISQPVRGYLPASVAARARGLRHPRRVRGRQRRRSGARCRWRGRRARASGAGPEPDRSAHLALARPLGGRRAGVSRRGLEPRTSRTRSTCTRIVCSRAALADRPSWQRRARRGRGRSRRRRWRAPRRRLTRAPAELGLEDVYA